MAATGIPMANCPPKPQRTRWVASEREESMNATRTLASSLAVWVIVAQAAPASLMLRVEPAGGNLRLIFDSLPGTNYQFQISTNLATWMDWGEIIPGDGFSKTQLVSSVSQPMACFRLRAKEATLSTAPSDAEFTALVVGKTILGYAFLNSTRFDWSGELGNWDYSRTDNSTGKLVFTYDVDGNNPAIYREEIILTFQTNTQGTFRFSVYQFGVEDPGSLSTGPFDLSGP